MRKLYLTPFGRYQVRYLDGSVRGARWDDTACVFITGRGDERRALDMLRIAAVAPVEHDSRVRWTRYADCYRSKFKPCDARWRHPYGTPRARDLLASTHAGVSQMGERR